MKKYFVLALSLALSMTSVSGMKWNVVQPVKAEEVEEVKEAAEDITVIKEDILSYDLSQTREDFEKAEKDDHFFDGKEKDDLFYNALKDRIIEIARSDVKTYEFEIVKELEEEPDVEKVMDQIVEDMECYLYWTDGKVSYKHYHVNDDPNCHVLFQFYNRGITEENGIYSDGNGNQIIPWDQVDHYYTLEELKEKAGDSLVLIMDDDGEHILFVAGNFSDKKIKDENDALAAIIEMKNLIGYNENAIYEVVAITQDSLGNTYYRFGEKIEEQFLENATQIVVGVDKDGYLSCIAAPSYSIIGDREYDGIEYQDVVDALNDQFSGAGWQYIDVGEVIIEFNETINQYCYVYVLTNEYGEYAKFYYSLNSNETGTAYDMKQYNSIDDLDANLPSHSYFFDPDIETEMMSFKDKFGNVVELPVAYDPDHGYYILDKDRNMIAILTERPGGLSVFDREEPFYFQNPEDIPPHYVSAFHNMQNSFDAYNAAGLYTDNKPIKLIFASTTTEANAYAKFYGDSIEITLYNNPIIASYDVVSHEITHAFTQYIAGNINYYNCTGALMESYADICGNIMEMIAYENGLIPNATVDVVNWLINESDDPIRDMSDPNHFSNPEEVFGLYYSINTANPNSSDDQGGVHSNSGILNHIVYRMHTEAGIPLKDLVSIFFNTQHLLTNHSTFKDVEGFVKYMMQNMGYGKDKIKLVEKFFKEAGTDKYSENNSWNTLEVKDGLQKVVYEVDGSDCLNEDQHLMLYGVKPSEDGETNDLYTFSDDIEGNYGTIVEEGTEFNGYVAGVMNNAEQMFFADMNFIPTEGETQTVNVLDVISAAYSGVSHKPSASNDMANEVVSNLLDVLTQIIIHAPSSMHTYLLEFTNYNSDNDNVGVQATAQYSEEKQGYDVVMRNDAEYDLRFYDPEDKEAEEIKVEDFTVPETEDGHAEVSLDVEPSAQEISE